MSNAVNMMNEDGLIAASDSGVEIGTLEKGSELPLVVSSGGGSIDLADWIRENRALVDEKVLEVGGVLFRGFLDGSVEAYQRVFDSLGLSPMIYSEGATPRSSVAKDVYTSTEFPAEEVIALHNELSYVNGWPTQFLFYCSKAAKAGGETPIADMRKVYSRMDPEIIEEFNRRGGWMLVRNFDQKVSLSWQQSFHIEDKAELEAYFKTADIDFEWVTENHLRTRQIRPISIRHPKTREFVWFNHMAFWHDSGLKPDMREAMLSVFGEENLPYNTYYGDGGRIDDAVVAKVNEVYREETVAFSWRKGDLLWLDNSSVAHGRNRFEGERLILASMANPCSDRGL